jgi:hypothetical protein
MKDMLNEAMLIANDSTAVSALINSGKYQRLNKQERQVMECMLKNTQNDMRRMINEGTLTADIATFTPILLPMVRRMFPALIANDLLGIQEMKMPTGYIYALVNQYLGNGVHKVGDRPTPAGVIYEFDTDIEDAITAGSITASTFEVGATIGDGKVLYVEGNKILASFVTTKLTVGTTFGGDSTATPVVPPVTITGIYTNEAAFGKILKNFSGPYATGDAEVLGDKMNEIGFSVSRKSIEVKSRKLKGRYTVEMYQDLQAQHNLTADEEIMNLMQYEIQAEIDREVVDFVNSNATQLPDTNFAFPVSTGSQIIIPDGRWEIERYRAQTVRISKEAQLIGIDTKRGIGNVLLVSPLVATMLEQVGTISSAPVPSELTTTVSGGYAGIFDNKYTVVVDQYAASDYCTVLYKGADNRDAMGFFAPYVPLQFIKTTAYETGQPAIIASTRYCLETIPGVETPNSNDRAKLYARSFGIDFANTILAR